jgi:hypothetical protein
MSDQYYADVVFNVWRAGGDPAAVSRHRVEACEQGGCQAEDVAGYELQLQEARKAVARDLAAWEAGYAALD